MAKGPKQRYGLKIYMPVNEEFAKRWDETFGKKKPEEIVYGSDTETGRRTFRVKNDG